MKCCGTCKWFYRRTEQRGFCDWPDLHWPQAMAYRETYETHEELGTDCPTYAPAERGT